MAASCKARCTARRRSSPIVSPPCCLAPGRTYYQQSTYECTLSRSVPVPFTGGQYLATELSLLSRKHLSATLRERASHYLVLFCCRFTLFLSCITCNTLKFELSTIASTYLTQTDRQALMPSTGARTTQLPASDSGATPVTYMAAGF